MKDLKNFCKLYNINIPVEEHKDYYLDVLRKAGNTELNNLINIYTEYEKNINDPFSHKMRCMDSLINKLKNTQVYQKFNTDPELTTLFSQKIDTVNTFIQSTYNSDNIYLSIDISKANYTALKYHDEHNELGSSWDNFLDINNIPEVFKHSKSFRQHVLGNLNPKRFQRQQILWMVELVNKLKENNHQLGELVLLTHDEIIYKLTKEEYEKYDSSHPINFYSTSVINFKLTFYTLENIGDKKFIKKSFNGNKQLFGVEGNMYYMYLKKYILNEPYDERDLLFKVDKRVVKWMELL